MATCPTLGCGRALSRTGKCKKCYMRRWQAENRDRIRARNRTRWANSPEWREKQARRQRESLDNRHGFTPSIIAEMTMRQGGLCAICSVEMTIGGKWTGLCRDHCHTTNRPRGLLCRACNSVLGHYEKRQRPAGLRISQYETYMYPPPQAAPGPEAMAGSGSMPPTMGQPPLQAVA